MRHSPPRNAQSFHDLTALGIAVGCLWVLIGVAWAPRGGWTQLLWLCDVATLGTACGLVARNRLVLTAQFSGMLVYHTAWHIDFLSYVLFGWMPFQATAYMFGGDLTAYEKALSFYQHTFIVLMCAWGLVRAGVSKWGWIFQAAQTAVALLLTYLFTRPADNINWIFGAGLPDLSPAARSPAPYYLLLILLPPLFVYAPTNYLATVLAGKMRLPIGRTSPAAAAVASVGLLGIGVAGWVGWMCQPQLHLSKSLTDIPAAMERMPTGATSPRVDAILFGMPGHERKLPLLAWPNELPHSSGPDGQAGLLLLRQLVQRDNVTSIPQAPQLVIVEGTRGRKGTVVCAVVGADSYYAQPECDAETALERFRVYGHLGSEGLTEFLQPNGAIRVPAAHQFMSGHSLQSLFVISVVAFNSKVATRSPFYLVRRTGVWTPDDVIWASTDGVTTATIR